MSDDIFNSIKGFQINPELQINPGLKMNPPFSDIGKNIIEPLNVPAPQNYYLADYQYEIIRNAITEFENSLDQDHEVALKLASFGQTIVLNITDLGYSNPSLIHYYGFIDGSDSKAELIQHVNQINFLLLAVRKADPNKQPRRIGFELKPAELEDLEPEE